jgi:glycosyltransferase involved in cell wall biosynthesis
MGTFREELRQEIDAFVARQKRAIPIDETLRIDLHCHDRESDVPDERIGRILRCPETWIETAAVVEALRRAGMDAVTITNHNNARSCYALLERGEDVLTGAEFTCTVPEHDARFHVLAYGFEPAQEERMQRLRRDIYRFAEFAAEHEIPTVLAHPLYFHTPRSASTVLLLEKLSLVFERFEALNGQRDTWQNLLLSAWVEGLDRERLETLSRRHGIDPRRSCREPFRKRMTGGSDCHMGLFVGRAGTLLRVPALASRLRAGERRSALALEALRGGELAPFGGYTCEEKLSASILDFVCQAALHLEDPGMLRLLLHQGGARDKLGAALAANLLFELRRHRFTIRFLRAFHEALHGKRPGFLLRRVIARPLRPVLEELDRVARGRQETPEAFEAAVREALPRIFHCFNLILAGRVAEKARKLGEPGAEAASAVELLDRLELPLGLRDLFAGASSPPRAAGPSTMSIARWSDGLPFPFLASLALAGVSFASCRALFRGRARLDEVARAVGRHRHPERALWLTDSFDDRNGVASTLRLLHAEVKRRDLPIDFAVCSSELDPDDHLLVFPPIAEFTTRYSPEQPFRVVDLLELSRRFVEGGYDRVVCSTEGAMGLVALYLKHALAVPATFYLHTDWLDFARRRLHLDRRNLDRVRRMLRAFYRQFDGIFVLNREHEEWLAGDTMRIPAERIRLTAHWVAEAFHPRLVARERAIAGLCPDERAVLYAGRLSEEKGVLELPAILRKVRARIPRARLVVAGAGPAELALRAAAPEAVFLGWLDPESLAKVYSAADVLLMPSRFDTFGCSILEAMSCGLPVVAYDVKGPRDLIVHGHSGLLGQSLSELARQVSRVLASTDLRVRLHLGARDRASEFEAESILAGLLGGLGLGPGAGPTRPRDDEEAELAALA